MEFLFMLLAINLADKLGELKELPSWYLEWAPVLVVIGGHLFAIGRIIVATTKNTNDDTFWNNYILPIAKLMGWVLDSPPKPVESQMKKTMSYVLGMGNGVSMGAGRRPALRWAVRRHARKAGLDVSDNELMDSIVEECESAQAKMKSGPLMTILEWIIANPETVIGIIKMLITLFAAQKESEVSSAE